MTIELEPEFIRDYNSSSDSADSETHRVLNDFYLAEKKQHRHRVDELTLFGPSKADELAK